MNTAKLRLIEEILEKAIEDGILAGGSAAVTKDGETVYVTHTGMADKEKGLKMSDNTIFRLFSLSKPVTAVAAMILLEQGKLDLHYPLKLIIPEFENMTVLENGVPVPAKRDITIADLLNMTSGICYPGGDGAAGKMGEVFWKIHQEYQSGSPVSTMEYAKRAASVPLAFQPGDRWEYGFSADIMGAVIEKLSGMRYGEFLKKEIFEPLGMKDTGFYVPENKLKDFAQLYDYGTPDHKPKIFEGFFLGVGDYHIPPAFESGGAGLVSTMRDYTKFAKMLANNGELDGVRILGRKTIDLMACDHLTQHQKRSFDWDSTKGYGYGCLVRVLTDPAAAGTNADIGEFGWDGWAGCYVTVDRKENLSFQLFIQKCGGDLELTRKLRNIVYSAL